MKWFGWTEAQFFYTYTHKSNDLGTSKKKINNLYVLIIVNHKSNVPGTSKKKSIAKYVLIIVKWEGSWIDTSYRMTFYKKEGIIIRELLLKSHFLNLL
jgi:hypothetical protein